jgi:sigma-B regulation protein RsbU (phosphoserine phosphatase)
MNLAREMQERLCRPADPGPGYDVGGATHPAVAVNGDFYDVLRFVDGSVGLAIADVCGHGIGAALVMAQTRALLRAFAESESDPAALCARLNRWLAKDLDDKHYVTLFLARIDPAAPGLDYANAGHPAARLWPVGGSGPLLLESTSIPLGILEELPVEPAPSLPIHPGDLLVLLTDGGLETTRPDGQEFGAARVRAAVERLAGAASSDIADGLCREVLAWAHPLPRQDDLTALVCRMLPRP